MKIEFGALAPSLMVQLRGFFPVVILRLFSRDANAITRLRVRGLITDSEAARARKRLVKRIEDSARG